MENYKVTKDEKITFNIIIKNMINVLGIERTDELIAEVANKSEIKNEIYKLYDKLKKEYNK
jgi:hypothetical protein